MAQLLAIAVLGLDVVDVCFVVVVLLQKAMAELPEGAWLKLSSTSHLSRDWVETRPALGLFVNTATDLRHREILTIVLICSVSITS